MDPNVHMLCPHCQAPISEVFFFCPLCGKKLKEPPVTLTFGKQISVYLLSILLPPLGLWPGIRYMSQDDPKAKMVGIIAIILTIVSSIVVVWSSIYLLNQFSGILNDKTQEYQRLSY